MPPRIVVVTGANRGIGLGLVQQLLKTEGISHVIATARDVEKAEVLNSIKDQKLHVVPLDVTCDKSIDNFVEKVSEIVGEDGLNVLINNAGIFVPYDIKLTPDRSKLVEQINVNAISVVIVTQKLLPLLEKAASLASNKEELSIERAAVLNISSAAASITENTHGSGIFHSLADRMSKTTLNQFARTFSVDVKDSGILVTSFCPGWVQTDLGTKDAFLTVEQSTSALVASFSKLNNTHHGGFYNRNLKAFQF